MESEINHSPLSLIYYANAQLELLEMNVKVTEKPSASPSGPSPSISIQIFLEDKIVGEIWKVALSAPPVCDH